ncbi:hypothetical protein GCM10010508_43320 [Streptomyces naganishii JCM 4654]|uniref:Integral membrane protein n=1 Tax=Streptomyces naganishii JCM 4654 TaxID=1306179 RepID=A0A918Y7R7_9ACTN|nr:hypothetical protein GCM10010508_43320 [Streptomyces naganishii JCM 4654]
MGVSVVVRGVRAGVFASVCVLLAAAGHGLAVGAMPPLWADGGGFLGVFVGGWLLGGRERSLAGISGAMLVTQVALHFVFDAARGMGEPVAGAMPSGSSIGSAMDMGGPSRMTMDAAVASASSAHPPHTLTPHALAAHLLAALVAAWWLRCGEAALWCLLRRAVGFVPALRALWRGAPDPAHARSVTRVRTGSVARRLRRLLLRHAVGRRGPPRRIPYDVRENTTSLVRRSVQSCPGHTARHQPQPPPPHVPCAVPAP